MIDEIKPRTVVPTDVLEKKRQERMALLRNRPPARGSNVAKGATLGPDEPIRRESAEENISVGGAISFALATVEKYRDQNLLIKDYLSFLRDSVTAGIEVNLTRAAARKEIDSLLSYNMENILRSIVRGQQAEPAIRVELSDIARQRNDSDLIWKLAVVKAYLNVYKSYAQELLKQFENENGEFDEERLLQAHLVYEGKNVLMAVEERARALLGMNAALDGIPFLLSKRSLSTLLENLKEVQDNPPACPPLFRYALAKKCFEELRNLLP